ncbi:MAG TPA: hypothetical protein DDY87_04145, partial [Clostridiales bacterium]|nr:hypothetical protein [Clostridiales bacterium]
MKKARKIVISVICCILVITLIVGGIVFWRSKNAMSVEVYPVSNLTSSYWGDSTQLTGNVSTGKVQSVPLKDSLIESINVSEGDTVHVGDVLMVYDTTSYQLALQSDQARIALLESQIAQANRDISKYQTLKPSEDAPQPTEKVIDHGELAIRGRIDAGDYAGDGQTYLCTGETVVTAAFLELLAQKQAGAEFQLYEDDTLYGSWYVDGSMLSPAAPGADDEPGDDAEPAGEDAAAPTALSFSDWTLGDGLSFTGDGVSVDFSVPHPAYGQFTSCTPVPYERYETVYEDGYTPDGSENYMYSKKELADMVKQAQQQLAGYQLDLKSAQITYQQDQLVSDHGEVLAAIDGVVTEVKDASSLAAGDTLLTVKGSENFTVTAYVGELSLNTVAVGDTLNVNTYESGTSTTATVTEIGTSPVDGSFGWGNDNPNNSYYPVYATVDDPDVQMTVGEYCE